MALDRVFYGTIEGVARAIREERISPVEVVEAHLARIAEGQGKLNAFVHMDAEGARRQGEEKSRSLATLGMTKMGNAELVPLFGVPVTVKSCLDVAGWPAAAGSLLRKDYWAVQDAPLVARLRAAGAIVVGTTNTPEYLMAYETDNLVSGKTSNPWDLARSSGGSSGGEAAAIAAGCSMGGVGSDGGGSVRVPAHFCGICGLKPTPGRIPATGHFPGGGGAFGWIGVVGPMARTVADVRTLFEVMSGPDPGDALSAPVASRHVGEGNLKRLRVGVLESEALGESTSETKAATEKASRILSEQGIAVERKRVAGLEQAIELWWYFFGPVIAHLVQQGFQGNEAAMSPMLREFVAIATAEAKYDFDDFLQKCAERDELRAKILRQMEDVTVLLSPVSAGPAFRHGEGNWRSGEHECYRDTMRWSQWLNLAGFPGISVPMGTSPEGLPIGVQVIGRPFEDEVVMAVAEAIERGRGEWQAPPL